VLASLRNGSTRPCVSRELMATQVFPPSHKHSSPFRSQLSLHMLEAFLSQRRLYQNVAIMSLISPPSRVQELSFSSCQNTLEICPSPIRKFFCTTLHHGIRNATATHLSMLWVYEYSGLVLGSSPNNPSPCSRVLFWIDIGCLAGLWRKGGYVVERRLSACRSTNR
jgi:hypothetical protein